MSSFQQTLLIDTHGRRHARFVTRLREAGFELLTLPGPRAVPTPPSEGLLDALDAISLYSAILFTDEVALFLFREAAEAHGLTLDELPPAFHIDAGTEAPLTDGGLTALPIDADGDAVPPQLGFVENQYHLLLAGADPHTRLAQAFADAGARLNVVPLYGVHPPAPATIRAIDDRLVDGVIDCIVFFDADEVRRFSTMIPVFKQATILIAVAGLHLVAPVLTSGLRVDISPQSPCDDDAFADLIIQRLRDDDSGIDYNPGEHADLG